MRRILGSMALSDWWALSFIVVGMPIAYGIGHVLDALAKHLAGAH